MAIFKTLGDLKAKVDASKYVGSGDKTKRFLTLKAGEQVRFRFRQELTEDSPGYTDELGTAQLMMIQTNPGDFTKSAQWTGESEKDGFKDWGSEQGWRPKQHLLINVAVLTKNDNGEDVWEPRILDQKFTSAHCADQIVEFATEYETLLDRDYKIKREGEKQATKYSITPLKIVEADDSIADLELFDLNKAQRYVPYSEQEAFYTESQDNTKAESWE